MSNPYTIREAIDVLLGRKNPPNPVDLLGVVVSIVKASSSLQNSPKVELWITDQSLSPQENACVVLWGSSELSNVESHRMQSGDVVRFNGVKLQKLSSGTGENTYYFTYSHDNTEPGIKWYSFNHIRDATTTTTSNHRIPDAMQTFPKRIQDLKDHYHEMDKGGGRLSPLPCRFRTLNELQVSTGLLSNISIRVQQHELVQQKVTKKRRLASTTATSVMGFATVADSFQPDVIMTLIDTENRFADRLKEAKDTNKVLVINNVFTKRQSEVLGDNCVLGEIVLVPSKKSQVAWELSKGDDSPTQQLGMSSTLETATHHQIPTKRITVLGCLVDIEIARKLLHESQCLESPESFVQGVMTSDQKYYTQVTLHLESVGTTSEPFPREALAGPDILQTLCGGIEAAELASDKVLQSSVFDLVQAMLREQVKLNWTIQMDCQPFRVEHVVLPPS